MDTLEQSSPGVPFNSVYFLDQLILYRKTNVLPKKILSDYSGDKWRPAVACESNKLIG